MAIANINHWLDQWLVAEGGSSAAGSSNSHIMNQIAGQLDSALSGDPTWRAALEAVYNDVTGNTASGEPDNELLRLIAVEYGATSPSAQSSAAHLCKEISESGPIFELDDLANFQRWLRGDQASTLFQTTDTSTPVTADGQTVGRQEGFSPTAVDFIQATAGERPTYKTSIQNGLSVLRYDGGDDLASTSAPGNASGSIFIVLSIADLTSARNVYSASDKDDNNHYLVVWVDTSGFLRLNVKDGAGSDNGIRGDTVLSTGTPYILYVGSSGTAWQMRVNGVAQSLTVTSGSNNGNWYDAPTALDTHAVGSMRLLTGTAYLQGDIMEIADYSNPEKNGTEIGQVETRLSSRWGISI